MDDQSYRSVPVKPSEITPEPIYLTRRQFMAGLAVAGAAALLSACGVKPSGDAANAPSQAPDATASGLVDELGAPANSFEEITNYNNYYEFTESKEGVAPLAKKFKTSPWSVEVGGLVSNPKTYAIEDLLKRFTQEERIYRLRCVEGWSMVIPWTGFSLGKLLAEAQPKSEAKFVRFQSVTRPDEMPNQSAPFYPWPYEEGLRLDEAMHDLTLLATGLYGKPMPAQNGAPIRLVVPWKYGFKSIKGIVKIELVAEQPSTFWNRIAPNEYGFYSNVNPEVDHPRWSQASERRIGESKRRQTLMFNGYAGEVAQLYAGMDLRANY